MRVSNMTVIPEVPIIELEEDLKDWKRHTDPEGKVFWKNERTGKMTRTLPKFEQEDPKKGKMDETEKAAEEVVAPWKEIRRRRRNKGAPVLKNLEVKNPEEGLVTRTVDLKEVKNNLQEWIQPIKDEVKSLLEKGAVINTPEEDVKEFMAKYPQAEIFPGKGVFVKKPNKNKARGVVCGNFIRDEGETEYAACQTEATALRVTLMATAYKGWVIRSVDVRTAFFNAELDDEDVVLVRPPRIFF
jgi:hypothetical protein